MISSEKRNLASYITQNLNLALDSDSTETSYSNAFNIRVTDTGFLWIPRMPSSILINDALYEKIYEIASIALYPLYTLLKQNSLYVVSESVNDIHIQRALFFPWIKGIPQRLEIKNFSNFIAKQKAKEIPLMKNLALNYDDLISAAIAGNSGAGKSYFLSYLMSLINSFSDLIVIDPKMDTPSRWATKNKVKVIFPDANRSKSDYVNQINDVLANGLNLVQERQHILFTNPQTNLQHFTIVIDEVLSISEGIPKKLKDTFFSLLSQIALLGRSTRVHLILVSQRFDYNAIPVSVREQLNFLVQIGNINSRTTQFLFPDLDPSGIVIPIGKGTGLIQIIDSKHPYQIQPFLTPTYTTEGVVS